MNNALREAENHAHDKQFFAAIDRLDQALKTVHNNEEKTTILITIHNYLLEDKCFQQAESVFDQIKALNNGEIPKELPQKDNLTRHKTHGAQYGEKRNKLQPKLQY